MTALAIQTHSLTKVFRGIRGATHAVDGLSISVPEGSIYGLLGRNSAGKTTTIRMLMGLARPTSGSSRIFGLDPVRERERVAMLSLVGYVPEDKTLLGLTARKLFELNRCFYPETWSDDLARKAVEHRATHRYTFSQALHGQQDQIRSDYGYCAALAATHS